MASGKQGGDYGGKKKESGVKPAHSTIHKGKKKESGVKPPHSTIRKKRTFEVHGQRPWRQKLLDFVPFLPSHWL
jgi:hypothetical protein